MAVPCNGIVDYGRGGDLRIGVGVGVGGDVGLEEYGMSQEGFCLLCNNRGGIVSYN